MSYQDIINQQRSESWLSKGGLTIPEDIRTATSSPLNWWSGLNPIRYANDNLPNIGTLLRSFTSSELRGLIESTSSSLLETSYNINRTYNTRRYSDIDLTSVGQAVATSLAVRRNDRDIFENSFLARDLFLNPGLTSAFIDANPYTGDNDFWDRLNSMQEQNKSWLQRIMDAIAKELENLTGRVRSEGNRLTRRINSLFEAQSRTVILPSSSFTFSAIPSTQNLGTLDIIGAVTTIASSILNTFLLKSIAMPPAASGAIIKTTAAIVLKDLASAGGRAIKYFVANDLRAIVGLLPKIFNLTGTFTGVWGFLMTAAPYIICAAVITIAAIRMARKTDVGTWLNVLAFKDKESRPDEGVAKIYGNKVERINDFVGLRNRLVQDSGRNYSKIYGFSFDGFNGNRRLCLDMSLPVPVPLAPMEAEQLWSRFSSRYPHLINDNVSPF